MAAISRGSANRLAISCARNVAVLNGAKELPVSLSAPLPPMVAGVSRFMAYSGKLAISASALSNDHKVLPPNFLVRNFLFFRNS